MIYLKNYWVGVKQQSLTNTKIYKLIAVNSIHSMNFKWQLLVELTNAYYCIYVFFMRYDIQ
jgi:hypothetical protein